MPPIALPDPPLDDGVVALRGFESGDVAAPVAACQDPEIPRWTLVPSPYTEDHARAWLRRAADAGYWLAAPARGRGIATRAVGLVAGWA